MDAPSTDRSGLAGSSARVGLAALLSRVLGFVRDMGMAFVLGAGPGADLFLAAFRIPNVLRRLFAEGALGAAFVPDYVSLASRQGIQGANAMARAVFLRLLSWGIPLLALALVFIDPLVEILVPGLAANGDLLMEGRMLFRICLPYALLASLAALGMGMLNGRSVFLLPAMAPACFNLALIGGVALVWLLDLSPPPVLALAVLAGGLLQAAMLLTPLAGSLIRAPKQAGNAALSRSILVRTIPAVAAGSGFQIMLLLAMAFASLQETGDIARLYFADRLAQFPLAISGSSLAIVALPRLSALAATGDERPFRLALGQALALSLFIALPAACGLAGLARPIVGLLFGHGAFDQDSVLATSRMLICFAPAIPGLALLSPLLAAYLARKRLARPLWALLPALAAFGAGSLWLPDLLGSAGIALAASLGVWVNVLLLSPGMGTWSALSRSMYTCLPISLALALGTHCQARWLPHWPDIAHAALIPLWAAAYLSISRLAGSPGCNQLAALFTGRR